MTKEPEKQSFEEQMAALEQIVTRLQGGQLSLDESIKDFQAGMQLAKDLQAHLDGAQATLAQLMDDDGQLQPAEEAGEDLSNNGVQNQRYHSEFAKKGDDEDA